MCVGGSTTAGLFNSKQRKLAIRCVCVIHFTLIKSYIGMQRIEEAKLVTAGRDFTPNFANKPNSVWFINAQIF